MKRKHNIIITCFLLICILSAQAVAPRTKAKAFVIPAGVYIVSSLLIASGIIVANQENLLPIANTVYDSMPETAQDMFDVMGGFVDSASVKAVTVGSVAMSYFNAACQTIFGITPAATYKQSEFGNLLSVDTAYSSITSPIDIKATVPIIYTFISNTTINSKMGIYDIQYIIGTNGNPMYTRIICPDGYMFEMDSKSFQWNYGSGAKLYAPVIYGAGTATPEIKFFIKDAYTGNVVLGSWSLNSPYGTMYNPTTNAWTAINVSYGTLYEGLLAHKGDAFSPSAMIDQEKFANTAGAEGATSPETAQETTVKASQDLNLIAQNTAETIKAIDGVSTGVDNMSSTLKKAIETATSAITSAVNAVTTGVTTAINAVTSAVNAVNTAISDLINSLYQSFVNALTYVFVPTLTLTSISDIIVGKLNLGFIPQTSFSSQPIAVDIPLGTYTQHMVLDNSLWAQFRSYMAGFVYFSFAWLFYKKVVSIGGND
jgi:hypothetical protein